MIAVVLAAEIVVPLINAVENVMRELLDMDDALTENCPFCAVAVAPVLPVAPVGPVIPLAPVTPVLPCGPVAPVTPLVPVAPVLPIEPVAPV